MKFALVAFAVVLLAFAPAARADTFQMDGGGAFLSGVHFGANGVVAGPTVETFNASFIYDSLSLSVSNMSVTSQGLLGSDFAFAGVTDNGFDTLFQWSNDEAILTGAFRDGDFGLASRVHFPIDSHGTKAILLTCLNDKCTDDFFDPVTGKHGPGFPESFMGADFLGPSPVPEPSSLTLLASGLLAGAFLLRRRITRFRFGNLRIAEPTR